MAKVLFKGFQQVFMADYLQAVSQGEAKHYMWLVRPDAAKTDPTIENEGELYFGTRHYGHVSGTEQAALAQALISAGFDTDGSYLAYAAGQYTADAVSVLDATSKLDDALKDLDAEVKTDKPVAGNGIALTPSATGTTIEVAVKSGDKVLQSEASGISATLQIVKLATGDTEYDAQYAAQYKLVGIDGTTPLGHTIDLYKDQFLKEVEYVPEMTQAIIDKYHLPGTVSGYTENPYLCMLWALDVDPSVEGDDSDVKGIAIPLAKIFEDFTLDFKLNNLQFAKQSDGSYTLTIDATQINTVAAITPDSSIAVGTPVAAGSSIEAALNAVYSGALIYVDGTDAEA